MNLSAAAPILGESDGSGFATCLSAEVIRLHSPEASGVTERRIPHGLSVGSFEKFITFSENGNAELRSKSVSES